MKDIATYIGEAVASRTSGKYNNNLGPRKENVLNWLEYNDFKRYEWDGVGDKHIEVDERTYMVGPGAKVGRNRYNWISIHTPDIYELILWFGENDMFKEYRLDSEKNSGKYLKDFSNVVKILDGSK
jgi:hypothetical protein